MQAGQCTSVGYEGCVDTQFKIVLHPRTFFFDLSFKTCTSIWFCRTSNSGSVMAVQSSRTHAIYYIHFPPT